MDQYVSPKWASEDWCTASGTDQNCSLYEKITNINAGPDARAKWLDWDSGYKRFFWNEDPKFSFYIQPYDTKDSLNGYMYIWDESKTNKSKNQIDQDQLINDHKSFNCDTASNVPGCVITHDRNCCSDNQVCTVPPYDQYVECMIPAWNPSSWNNTPRAGTCGGTPMNPNTGQETKNSSWYADPTDGTIYNYVQPTSSYSPSDGFCSCTNFNCQVGWVTSPTSNPYYFLFGQNEVDSDQAQNPDNPLGNVNVIGSFSGNMGSQGYTTGCNTGGLANLDYRNCGAAGDKSSFSWITETSAMACCALPTSAAEGYDQCKGAFNPGTNIQKCSSLMSDNCFDIWTDCGENGESSCRSLYRGEICDNYINQGSEGSKLSVQGTLTNYINSKQRSDFPDYISWKLRDKVYTKEDGTQVDSPSKQWYDNYKCGATKSTSCEDGQESGCCRDDSNDPFFASTIPYLCNTGKYTDSSCRFNPGNPTGICDGLLRYFCQSFDRDDLTRDENLAGLCGCFLTPTGSTTPIMAPTVQGITWENQVGYPKLPSPYYTNIPTGDICDPMCRLANIPQCAGVCQSNMCVIDNVTLNYVNSDVSGTTLSQICGSCSNPDQDGGQCICYMDDITVNSYNSSIKGGVNLSQTCGQCWQQDDSGWYQVDCSTGKRIGDEPVKPDDPGKDKPFWKKTYFTVMIVVIVLAIVLFLGFWLHQRHKYKTASDIKTQQTFDDYYYY